MSEAAAQEPASPSTLRELLDEVAAEQRRRGAEELTEEEAMALALEAQREVREEMRREGTR